MGEWCSSLFEKELESQGKYRSSSSVNYEDLAGQQVAKHY